MGVGIGISTITSIGDRWGKTTLSVNLLNNNRGGGQKASRVREILQNREEPKSAEKGLGQDSSRHSRQNSETNCSVLEGSKNGGLVIEGINLNTTTSGGQWYAKTRKRRHNSSNHKILSRCWSSR